MADSMAVPTVDKKLKKMIYELNYQLNESEMELIEAQHSVDTLTDENHILREENVKLWLKLNSLGVTAL